MAALLMLLVAVLPDNELNRATTTGKDAPLILTRFLTSA